MKRACLALFSILSSFSGAAQDPPQNATAQQPKLEKCAVSGTVVRLGTSEPLKSAYIRLAVPGERGTSLGTTTDPAGKFVLKNIEPGRYRLTVGRNGYVTQEYGQRSPGDPGAILALSPGQKVPDLLFRMIPAAIISGHIQDEDGESLPWVQVTALHEAYVEGKQKLTSETVVTTNDLGEYRLFNLPPGRYFVKANYQPGMTVSGYWQFRSTETDASGGYAPTYYPGTSDPVKAATITVKSGEEARSVDFILRQVPVFKIRGRVFNAITGKPARNAYVELRPRNSRMAWEFPNRGSADKPDGGFEIRDVTPGSYTLIAYLWDEDKSYAVRQQVELGAADVEGVLLTFTEGATISGHLSWDGKPSLREGESGIYLRPAEEDVYYYGGSGKVQSDGAFTLKNVSEGRYRVEVGGTAEDCFVQSVRYGSVDALADGFTLRRGSDATLEVTVSSRGARIEGAVKNSDELPATGVWVALVPDEAHRSQASLYKSATTDQYGRFVLRGIAPGEYKLFSWDEVERGAWQDADFLQPFEAKGEKVRLELGAREMVQLKLIDTKKAQKP